MFVAFFVHKSQNLCYCVFHPPNEITTGGGGICPGTVPQVWAVCIFFVPVHTRGYQSYIISLNLLQGGKLHSHVKINAL